MYCITPLHRKLDALRRPAPVPMPRIQWRPKDPPPPFELVSSPSGQTPEQRRRELSDKWAKDKFRRLMARYLLVQWRIGHPDGIRKRPWTRQELILLVAEAFGEEEWAIVSRRTSQPLVWTRQAAVWLCKRFTACSLPAIGRAFGGRDHTTVMHSIRKVEAIVARYALDCGEDPSAWAKALAELPAEAWVGR